MQDENKRLFISTLESALIMYSRENLARLEYWVCNGDEYITVKFTTGFEWTINITGDSCLGIMKDVVRGLE
jgi:hypothetical protein